MKSNSKSEKSRQAKKERKLVSTFLQKVLQLKGQQEVREVTFGQPTPYRCLLLDNRDYQLKQSTEELLALIQNRGHGLIDDCFVLPSKLWTLLRFATSDDLATFREDLGGVMAFWPPSRASPPLVLSLINCTSLPDGAPQGLTVIEDFLSEEEEQALVQFAEDCFSSPADTKTVVRLKNRSAVHFGHVFDYTANTISSTCGNIEPNYIPETPDQLTINRYDQQAGDHIPPHVDTHSMCTDWLLSLSMEEEKEKGSDGSSKWKHLVHLPPRSALLLRGEARYQWRHAIAQTSLDVVPLRGSGNTCRLALSPRARQSTSTTTTTSSSIRYSFTLRKVTPPGYQCRCPYPLLCDSQNSSTIEQTSPPSPTSPSLNSSEAASLEAEYVHRTYDSIAAHFSATRYGQWPSVVHFLSTLPAGSLVLDLIMLGTDRSANLLSICRQRGFETFQEDILHLQSTLKNDLFEGLLCIAVLHHLATEERRLEALRSLVSLLVPGTGRALIYVWAFEQRRKEDGVESRYIEKKKDGRRFEENRGGGQSGTQFRQQDLFVPWKRGVNKEKKKEQEDTSSSEPSSTALRFYHVFKEGELEALLSRLGHLITTERLFYDQGNWCAVIKRNRC
ncbi:Alkylated DNA repair protein alkB 8 [Tyrophagus putrescentiae]|nr:Alkylated DNA repair protein alkB 8 [Tyrophagus putrescentiae]